MCIYANIYIYIYIYLYLCYNLEITGQHGHLNIIYSVCNFSASLGEIVRSKNGGTTAAMTAWKPCYEFTRTPCQFQEGAFKSQPIIYIYIYTVLILIINNNVIQLTMILHTNMYVYIYIYIYIIYIYIIYTKISTGQFWQDKELLTQLAIPPAAFALRKGCCPAAGVWLEIPVLGFHLTGGASEEFFFLTRNNI